MSQKPPLNIAIAWLVPAIGATLFVTIQCFSFVNAYIGSVGAMQAMTFGSGASWGVSIFYGAWVLPPLLALIGTRATDWGMLVIGAVLFAMSTLAGVADGLRDGSHLVGLELLAVTLPGAVALILSWRQIRSR